jgi:Periplasmic copper-binding protein (NosD)
MNIRTILIEVVVVAIASLLLASVAEAEEPRTYVSAQTGHDTNPCTLDHPCRSFGQALTQVQAGGEVVAIDSGDYEPFQITKGVTVEAAPGVYAGITSSSAFGVQSYGTAAVVVLRGLSFNGLEAAQSSGKGIDFGGGTLHVENCVINGFFLGITYTSGAGRLFVTDTIVRNCGGGIVVQAANSVQPPSQATIEHCRFDNNRLGVRAAFNTRVTVRDSIFSGSDSSAPGFGLLADSAPPRTFAELNVENCLVSGFKDFGIFADTNSRIRVSNSTITNNGTGVSSSGNGIISSRGNNTLEGNGFNGVFNAQFAPH